MYGEMATVRKLSDHFSPDLLFDEDKGLKTSPLYLGISSKCRDEAIGKRLFLPHFRRFEGCLIRRYEGTSVRVLSEFDT